MIKTEAPSDNVSVFARFRPGSPDEAHITLAEENTSLTSSFF